MKRTLKRFEIDWWIVVPSLFLLSIGFALQASIAYKTVGVELQVDLLTQALAVIGGIAAGIALRGISQSTIRRNTPYFYGAVLVVLLLVLTVGVESGGATRWIQIFGLQLQPTEFAKIALIASLANILDTHRHRANSVRLVSLSLATSLLLAIPIALQPDLGSSIVLIAIWLGMMLASRIRLSRYAFIVLSIVAAAALLTPFLAEYQQERLVSYFNPTRDTSGAAYNVTQAGIAIGSGGLTGRGLTSGTQSQLNFLPSQHTDFAFAVLSEKLGLLGASLTLLAMSVLLLRFFYRAWQTEIQYHRLLFVGIAAFLAFHIIVNIGMNVGFVPVTGLPLPFISYGGTFMFALMLLISYVALLPGNSSRR